MDTIDYGAEAELFSAPARASRRQPIGYRRFASAAEALRFAIEELAPASLAGAYLEVGEERFDSRDMRRLYESANYPLARREAPAAPPGVRLSGPAAKTQVAPRNAAPGTTGAKKTGN